MIQYFNTHLDQFGWADTVCYGDILIVWLRLSLWATLRWRTVRGSKVGGGLWGVRQYLYMASVPLFVGPRPALHTPHCLHLDGIGITCARQGGLIHFWLLSGKVLDMALIDREDWAAGQLQEIHWVVDGMAQFCLTKQPMSISWWSQLWEGIMYTTLRCTYKNCRSLVCSVCKLGRTNSYLNVQTAIDMDLHVNVC